MNQTVDGVSRDITEEFQFNTVISKIRELVNAMSRYEPEGSDKDVVLSFAVDTTLKLLAPIAPHITEELWNKLGKEGSIHNQAWPTVNKESLVADSVEVVFQVNGKVRDKAQVASGLPKDELEKMALASDRVQKFMDGKDPMKVIVVPNKLVNIVVR